MATFEPDPVLLGVQLDSIRAQTREDWVCLISDDCSSHESFEALSAAVAGDARFVLFGSERRLGFYRNFERALGMVPRDASLVALADQDDRWGPRKLEVLARAIGSAQLAYGDARIVDRSGQVLQSTFWTERRPNTRDLASLLFANSVTGAAALFRRELLDVALPFPSVPGQPFHDHWLALVALARGDLSYVDEPLYDYVQHEGAVLGHGGAPSPSEVDAAAKGSRRSERWRQAYREDYRRILGFAQSLDERCGPLRDRRKRRSLERVLTSERSLLAPAWLGVRLARRSFGRSDTGGAERTLLAALAWRRLAGLRGYPGAQR
jgi:glycosyltransferase involved in cell wall biosynthesis